MGGVLSVVVSCGVPVLAGAGLGMGVKKDVEGWYRDIKKPSWTPPNWAFGPIWTALYTLMGYSALTVWRKGGGALPLGLYSLQLLLNLAWTPIFFGAHNLGGAAIDVTAMLGVIAATIVQFNKVDPKAAKLLLPYAGFSTFAAALTYNVWLENTKDGAKLKKKFGRFVRHAEDKSSDITSSLMQTTGQVTDAVVGKAVEIKEAVLGAADDKQPELEAKADEAQDKASSAKEDAKDAAGDAKKKAQEGTSHAKAKASSAADDAQKKGSQVADDVKHKAGKAGEEVKSAAGSAQDSAAKTASDVKDAVSSKVTDAKKAANKATK